MNIDAILGAFHERQADCLLVGGVNFLLRHKPLMTYDVDLWINDTPENRGAVNHALRDLGAEWGITDASWKPVSEDPTWMEIQGVYCLTTKHGAVDIFRSIKGLEGRYAECRAAAPEGRTPAGTYFRGLSDKHMLESEMALDPEDRREDRLKALREAVALGSPSVPSLAQQMPAPEKHKGYER